MTALLVACGLLIWLEFGVILAAFCCTSCTTRPPMWLFVSIVLFWPLMVFWGLVFGKHLD